jgi:hypothetical protein
MGRPKGSKNKKTLEKLEKKAVSKPSKKGAVEYEVSAPGEENTDATATFQIAMPDGFVPPKQNVLAVHTSARLQDWNRYVEMNIAIAATGSICRLPGSEMWPAETIALRVTAIAKAVTTALQGE